MALATITSKGQVTIPKNVRDSLQLRSGDKIEISLNDENEAIIKPVSKKVDAVFCLLHQAGREALSIDQMNKAIVDRMKQLSNDH